MKGKRYGLGATLVLALPLHAQVFTVDRPDYTESPNLVQPKHVHLESGWAQTGSTPEWGTMVRYRLAPRWEVRTTLARPLFWEVGAKWVWWHSDRFRLAWINHIQPLGGKGFRSVLSGEHSVHRYTLGWNIGRQMAASGQPGFSFFSHSHGFQLNPQWTLFVEGVHSAPGGNAALHGWTPLNAGCFWSVTPHVVLDAMAGLRPIDREVKLYAGLSVRLGK